MLISSEENIFKLKCDEKLTNDLNSQLNDLNHRMIPLKREWAKSVMAYNLTSKEAFIHRFVALPQKDGRKSADGMEQDFATGEELTGKYICSTIVKEKVDNYLLEYESREYSCGVKSIDREEDKYLVQYLQNQSFDTPQFRLANNSAFKDALIKKVGWLRPRIYDIKKKQKQVVFKQVKGKKTIDTKDVETVIKQGLELEYVDTENVYIDNLASNPQECFISTPYTDMELIAMFPFLDKILALNKINTNNVVLNEVREDSKAKNDTIQPQWLCNYKTGEYFSSWYFDPDSMMDFTKNYGQDVASTVKNNLDPNANGRDFRSVGMPKFHSLWNSMFFGEDYNSSGVSYFNQNRKYRLNEFYNWSQGRYILWIDKYVLYDGPMFEPYKECPIVPIYFDRDKSNGIYGKSVYDHLHTIQFEASDNETLLKQTAKMASVTFLEINSDRLEHPNVPIQANLLTTIRTKNTQDGEAPNGPAVQQINIQNQGVEMTSNILGRHGSTAEKMFPSTNQVNLQITKEEREQSISSRVLRPNAFLRTNAEQLSLFSYNVFTAKLFELRYFNISAIAIPVSVNKTRALIIRDTEEEIAKAKDYIVKKLEEEYQGRIQQATQYLMDDPNFQGQLEQFKNQKMQEYQQKLSRPEFKDKIKDTSDTNKLNEFILSQLEMEVKKFVQSQAQTMVQPIKDENMYICLDDLDNLVQAQKQFLFSFKQSKEEMQRTLLSFLNSVAQFPLAGYALDYGKFVREIAVMNGFNPEVILQEVGKTSELAGMASTKMQFYGDMQKNPAMAEALLDKMLGVAKEQLVFSQDSPVLANLKAVQDMMVESEIKLQTAKQAQDGQNKLAQEGFKATTKSLETQQQAIQEADVAEQSQPQNLMEAPQQP